MRYKSFILLQLIFLLLSCKNNDESNEKEVFDSSNESTFNESKDSDLTSSQFETVKIGNLEWASKNLNVSTFRNGDTIFHAQSNEEWERASKLHIPAYCYYDNNPSNGDVYGKLYNWYAVMDQRGLAPQGFYIPNNDEFWSILRNYGLNPFSNMDKKANVSSRLRESSSKSYRAVLCGYRYEFGSFKALNEEGRWWSSTNNWTKSQNNATSSYRPSELSIDKDFVSGPGAGMLSAGCGYSVRCIKGNLIRTTEIPILESEFFEVDNNGNARNGVVKFYDSSGGVFVSKTFVNGIENGERLSYDDYGELISQEMYKNGKLNGPSVYYYPSSWKHKISEGNYIDGEKAGEWINYDWIAKPELEEKFEMRIKSRELFKVHKISSVNSQVKKYELTHYGLQYGPTGSFKINLQGKTKTQIYKTLLKWTVSKPLLGMDIGTINSSKPSSGLLQFHINRNKVLTFGSKPINMSLNYSLSVLISDGNVLIKYNYIRYLNREEDRMLYDHKITEMFKNGIIKTEFENDKKVYESVINEVGESICKIFRI